MQSQNLSPLWMSTIVLRHLEQNDLPDLEWGGRYTHFRRLYREVYQSALKGTVIMWGADLPGTGVIGQLFVQLDSVRKEIADGKYRAYIYAFRVHPEFRRYGLGGRLLDIAEEDLRQRNFSLVTLNVARHNLDARRLYERAGYRVISAEPGLWSYLDDQNHRHEVNEPAWRMEKSLY